MRPDQGDTLPDITDNIRFNQIKHKISYFRKIILEECSKCGGLGEYILKSGNNQEKVRCECYNLLAFYIEMLKSNIPEQHLTILADELFKRKVVEINFFDENKPENSKEFDFNLKFMNPFLKNKKKRLKDSCSALLLGNNESGKTYGALYMLCDFIKNDYSAHYLRFKNYLNLLNSSYSDIEDKKLVKQIKNVKFLALDELGKEHGKSDYNTCELEELIKYRQDHRCSTLLITNLDIEPFFDTYGNHVKSALVKSYKMILFHPDASFRKKTRISW